MKLSMTVLIFLLAVLAVSAAPLPAASVDEHTDSYLRELRDEFTNSVGIRFVYIQPGSFVMGCESEKADPDEAPAHKVDFEEGFYMGVMEVTQEQWQKVMGYNDSLFKDPARPVEKVAWLEAKHFVATLNDREGTDRYSLPTEAEWEYACRAGSDSDYYWGNDVNGDFAWYRDNSDDMTRPAGTSRPNAWGLYDMSGNVAEWCLDVYANYPGSPLDPPSVDERPTPVVRGGSWASRADSLRSSNRSRLWDHYKLSSVGFRIKASR